MPENIANNRPEQTGRARAIAVYIRHTFGIHYGK